MHSPKKWRRCRAMAEEGLSKRLEEIDMSASESKLYSGILDVRCLYNACRVRPCALHTSI